MIKGEYIKNGTRFVRSNNQNVVFIQSNYLRQNIQALLEEKNINSIRIINNDYNLDNLDFLCDYDLNFIDSIDMFSDSVINIKGIYCLKNLKRIYTNNKKIDYSKFNKLKEVYGEVSNFSYQSLLELASLETLRIEKYKFEDLEPLRKNKKLRNLSLTSSKIKSLKGLNAFSNLEILELQYNKGLISLDGIGEMHNKLKLIRTNVTPNLKYVNEYLSSLPQLEVLDLSSKEVDSFKFLDKMKNLKILNIHNLITKVEDCNKKPLLDALHRTGGTIW